MQSSNLFTSVINLHRPTSQRIAKLRYYFYGRIVNINLRFDLYKRILTTYLILVCIQTYLYEKRLW